MSNQQTTKSTGPACKYANLSLASRLITLSLPTCPGGELESDFIATAKAKVSDGTIVQFSVGGTMSYPPSLLRLDNTSVVDAFVAAVGLVVQKYGLNGVNINLRVSQDLSCDCDVCVVTPM